MNKIQLEAALQLAKMDCENNPNQLNKNRLVQAQAAYDAFVKAQEEPAKPAAPKKATAPKKEKVGKVIVPTPDDNGAPAEDEETDADPDGTGALTEDEETDTDPDGTADNTGASDEETSETGEKKTEE
jgi:hypothetical protein